MLTHFSLGKRINNFYHAREVTGFIDGKMIEDAGKIYNIYTAAPVAELKTHFSKADIMHKNMLLHRK